MNILELFSGTESFSTAARLRGHTAFTIDNEEKFGPSLCKDILEVTTEDIPCRPDIIWASPPCQCFSVATIGRNWDPDTLEPKTEGARISKLLVMKTLELIDELEPRFFFIENPRAMLRKMPFMRGMLRATVTYCKYGETYQKPTDIWHNCMAWGPRPPCYAGSSCHERAPRGSRKGVQGLKGATERGIVPYELCEEILIDIESVQELFSE